MSKKRKISAETLALIHQQQRQRARERKARFDLLLQAVQHQLPQVKVTGCYLDTIRREANTNKAFNYSDALGRSLQAIAREETRKHDAALLGEPPARKKRRSRAKYPAPPRQLHAKSTPCRRDEVAAERLRRINAGERLDDMNAWERQQYINAQYRLGRIAEGKDKDPVKPVVSTGPRAPVPEYMRDVKPWLWNDPQREELIAFFLQRKLPFVVASRRLFKEWEAAGRPEEKQPEIVAAVTPAALPAETAEEATQTPDPVVKSCQRVKRAGKITAIETRPDQVYFAAEVSANFGGRCAITGIDMPEACQAAHLWSHKDNGPDTADNGIYLRADLHLLLDRGHMTIDPQTLRITLSSKAAENYSWLPEFVRTPRFTALNPEYIEIANRGGIK